ncbi:sugar 3,4-ketoisomerase [Parageobacillus thermoglucosidasius]|uniref:sugar 3,4-ketoisomerase n=1 Tax=Parageobacillus thermoglucosidasius TaxID=1426 RepID=UPI0027E7ECB6|nr:FdtA/QdtA family cupin domain-containing protein [Parageobacillus thermoglucosidasius]
MDIRFIDFKIMGDERGSLISLEQNKNIPFEIKRVYYIFNTKKGVRRGFHAHKKLKQVLIAVKGSCKIHLDDGFDTKEIVLDNPSKGLYLDSLVWREMYDFSDDCVLLVLASEFYTEEDYIRNYDDFKKHVYSKG